MQKHLKISFILAIGFVVSGSYGEITASPPISTSLSNTEVSKQIGSLTVEAGDYLAVLGSSNKGSTPVEAGLLISSTNG